LKRHFILRLSLHHATYVVVGAAVVVVGCAAGAEHGVVHNFGGVEQQDFWSLLLLLDTVMLFEPYPVG
jgi:hypothetical protein